jgi:hypothetical protein
MAGTSEMMDLLKSHSSLPSALSAAALLAVKVRIYGWISHSFCLR